MIEEIRQDNNCIVKAFENKRVAICKVHKDNQKTILQEWSSQKEASRNFRY